MPVRAVMPAWRQRKFAISKKLALECEDSYEDSYDSRPPALNKMVLEEAPVKNLEATSPTSIASAFDLPPEFMPIQLPGTWMVVGKKGKALPATKMYDEPPAKKKKKKKTRRNPPLDEPDLPLLTLGEEASTSKCLQKHGRTMAKREATAIRGKEARYWAGYQAGKEVKRDALNALIAALERAELQGNDDDDDASAAPLAQASKLKRTNKANSHKEKSRRRERFSSAAARCGLFEDDDGSWSFGQEPPPRVPPGASSHARQRTVAFDSDGFQTVIRKPRVGRLPPANSAEELAEPSGKRRKPDEGPQAESAAKKNQSQCSLM